MCLEVQPLIDEPVDVGGKAKVSSSPSAPGSGRAAVCGMVGKSGPDGAGDHPAGRAGSGFPALLEQATCWRRGLRSMPSEISFSIADAGLQFRAINRFLAFKSGVDCDGRTAQFYAAMLRIYFGLAATLAVAAARRLRRCCRHPPCLDLRSVAHFDAAFVVMAVGMLLTLPSNLVAALYRARGLYGRAVEAAELGVAGRRSSASWSRSSRPEACWPSRSPMSPRKCWPRPSY